MAISKLSPIKSTLALAIDYILNPEKTDNGKYTFAYGCSLDSRDAAKEFLNIRDLGTGKGNVLAQHIKLSFKGNEVTPEEAIQIGVELADKLLKGKYQYVLAAHTNTENIHIHLIFNNVDFENYRTFEYQENRGKVSWENLRKINDELCKEHNLSVIENPQTGKGKCYYEWQQDTLGKSWKSKLRYAIDETIMQSATFEDFLKNIRKKEIECVYNPENVIKIKFRMKGQERFSRGRTLGWYYDESQIRRRIEQYQLLKNGISGRNIRTKIIDTSNDVFQTSKGLLHWADIQNMKEASRLINYLTTHNLHSQEELEKSATSTYNDRMVIVSRLNSYQNRINELSDVIKVLRTYKKHKPVHEQYLQSKSKNKFQKENANALLKYDDVVEKLKQMFPNKKLPNLERLEKEKTELISQVKELNEEYKKIIIESSSDDELRNDKFDNLNDVSEHKKVQSLESIISDKSKINIPVISSIYDKSASKIVKLEDKNMILTDKSHKVQLKIEKANRFIEVYNQISSPSVAKAVPAPVFNFIKLIAEQKQNKVDSLRNKVEKHNNKIEANNKRIDKHTKRMETCEKVNVFLTNMKTSEGRQENFVVGLQEFQSMSLNRTTEKLATVNEKINNFSLAYENTNYASEKIKLRDKIAKLNSKKNKLEVKLEGLNSMGDKFTAVRETTAEKAETIISKSYDGIIKSATENPDRFAKNQVDTVIEVCNNIIDNELFEHSEQKKFGSIEQEDPDNYLKNAEMALEDDYDSIDGIINNGSKEKEHKKLQETPDEHKQQTRSSKSPLSRKQIKANAGKISKAEQNNDINKSKLKSQEL